MSALERWSRAKAEAPQGYIVMVRDGDRYVTFCMDALQCAGALGKRFTRTGADGTITFGIPSDDVDKYLSELLQCGKKVAIADPILARPLGKGGAA